MGALPHSRVMIHQAMGGAQGQAEDIKVEAQQILQIHQNLVQMYARMTGKSEAIIGEDLQRDNFMSAEEAKEYGLIDQVIKLQSLGDLPTRNAATEKVGKLPAATKEATPGVSRKPEAEEEPETKAI